MLQSSTLFRRLAWAKGVGSSDQALYEGSLAKKMDQSCDALDGNLCEG